MPIIERLLDEYDGTPNYKLGRVLTERVWGIELDPDLYERCVRSLERRWGPLPVQHNLIRGDYFRFEPPLGGFDLIVGNPPFGGTFDAEIEDMLDRRFGRYRGSKLKKETYSFFVAKALDELAPTGAMRFICSDTFLTIKTMKGLRHKLIDHGACEVDRLDSFSAETNQPMVVLTLHAGPPNETARIFGTPVNRQSMEKTENFSWAISDDVIEYFDGPTLGDFLVATGGMTIGKNEFFVRTIEGGHIVEPYEFEFFDDPITVDGERKRARLEKISAKQEERFRQAEAQGDTRRNVRVVRRDSPVTLSIPHPDYVRYNKATGDRLYSAPTHVVYWKDDGDAVLTFKKNGPWYLHGVGGRPFFLRRGLTWQLVSAKINARFLPSGYILDSGAPCAFLREGVADTELWFILGWLQTQLATQILKQVINHTRNIQGKDIERLPYPHWIDPRVKQQIIQTVESAVRAMLEQDERPAPDLAARLEEFFAWDRAVADGLAA